MNWDTEADDGLTLNDSHRSGWMKKDNLLEYLPDTPEDLRPLIIQTGWKARIKRMFGKSPEREQTKNYLANHPELWKKFLSRYSIEIDPVSENRFSWSGNDRLSRLDLRGSFASSQEGAERDAEKTINQVALEDAEEALHRPLYFDTKLNDGTELAIKIKTRGSKMSPFVCGYQFKHNGEIISNDRSGSHPEAALDKAIKSAQKTYDNMVFREENPTTSYSLT